MVTNKKGPPAKVDSRDPEHLDLAFRAASLRTDLDALLEQHGARLVIGWEGSWAITQFQFNDAPEHLALTIAKVAKNGRCQYFTSADEIAVANGQLRVGKHRMIISAVKTGRDKCLDATLTELDKGLLPANRTGEGHG